MTRKPHGFTLLEMLLATTLAALLLAAVLNLTAALSRDRVRIDQAASVKSPAALDLIRSDLSNSLAILSNTGTELELLGYAGIDPQSLVADRRLTRVLYRIERRGAVSVLLREQAYLDDMIRPDAWSDVVVVGATRLTVTTLTSEAPIQLGEDVTERLRSLNPGRPGLAAQPVPARARLRLESPKQVHEQEALLR